MTNYKTQFSLERRRHDLPYALQRMPNGRWVVLNRLYKPVGLRTDEYVDYDKFSKMLPGLTEQKQTLLSHSQQPASSDNDYTVWLYSDDCVPGNSEAFAKSYMEKLSILEDLGVFDD